MVGKETETCKMCVQGFLSHSWEQYLMYVLFFSFYYFLFDYISFGLSPDEVGEVGNEVGGYLRSADLNPGQLCHPAVPLTTCHVII